MAGTDNPVVKLTATLPDGSVATRRTPRAYTHVLAQQNPANGSWGARSWHGSMALAVKAQQALLHGKYGDPSLVTEVVPVDGAASKPVAKPAPALVPAPTVVPRTPQQLVEYNRPAYKAYVAAQEARRKETGKPITEQDGKVLGNARRTMDTLRPAYRVYRKAAAALRAAKKGAAPAAPKRTKNDGPQGLKDMLRLG